MILARCRPQREALLPKILRGISIQFLTRHSTQESKKRESQLRAGEVRTARDTKWIWFSYRHSNKMPTQGVLFTSKYWIMGEEQLRGEIEIALKVRWMMDCINWYRWLNLKDKRAGSVQRIRLLLKFSTINQIYRSNIILKSTTHSIFSHLMVCHPACNTITTIEKSQTLCRCLESQPFKDKTVRERAT